MGYCKHEWQKRSEELRAVFAGPERTVHEFYVCNRCLKIQEVQPGAQARQGPADDPGTNAA
jgi:hypothetical protein